MNPRYSSTIRKGERRDRAKELALLAESRRTADLDEVADAAGFWLVRQAPGEQRADS